VPGQVPREVATHHGQAGDSDLRFVHRLLPGGRLRLNRSATME
jgi:hypothetical protein